MAAKRKVTTKKYEGDDLHSWAVFVDGKVVNDLTGLNRQQATYYRKLIEADRLPCTTK